MAEPRAKRTEAIVKDQERLDPTSNVPVYLQIANLFRGKIARGELRPGQAIPAVSSLSKTLGVASMTVRFEYRFVTVKAACCSAVKTACSCCAVGA